MGKIKKDSLSLDGQNILVTGVSRSKGIGAAIIKRLSQAGAQVAAHGYSDYVHKPSTSTGSISNKRRQQ